MNPDILKIWNEQLYKEFHHQCWYYKIKLKAPLISIENELAHWAEWDALARTIRIKRDLIERHSWYVVVEVLKHEMAHQYVSEYHDEFQADHGEHFKAACTRLAVEPWARTASGILPDTHTFQSSSQLSPEHEKILQRAKKLLQLASSSNVNESFLAMKMAMELLEKHKLEGFVKDQKDLPETLVIYFNKEKISRTTSRLLSILNSYFNVRVLSSTLYNAKTLKKEKIAEIVGFTQDVKFSEYIFEFLSRELEYLWKKVQKSGLSGRVDKNSYQLGVIAGLEKKLECESRENKKATQYYSGNAEQALQNMESKVANYFYNKFPRIHTRRSSGTRISGAAYMTGQVAGGKIEIRRPISGQNGFGGYLT